VSDYSIATASDL